MGYGFSINYSKAVISISETILQKAGGIYFLAYFYTLSRKCTKKLMNLARYSEKNSC